ncbi:hypothetical protein RUM43_009291, partial [Polyplax serrata]
NTKFVKNVREICNFVVQKLDKQLSDRVKRERKKENNIKAGCDGVLEKLRGPRHKNYA